MKETAPQMNLMKGHGSSAEMSAAPVSHNRYRAS